MPNSILIGSGKGGVGKTTVTINLGMALSLMGRDVVVVDVDIPTPNVGFHLDIPSDAVTLNDVVRGRATLEQATFLYANRLKVIPSGIFIDSLEGFDPDAYRSVMKQINKKFDVVLFDCAPGLGNEVINTFKGGEMMVVVTTPELPSVADTAKSVQIATDLGVGVKGIIVNRSGHFKTEMKDAQISSTINDLPILGKIPEDSTVPTSIAEGVPVVMGHPLSPAGRAYKRVAHRLLGKKYVEKLSWADKINIFLKNY